MDLYRALNGAEAFASWVVGQPRNSFSRVLDCAARIQWRYVRIATVVTTVVLGLASSAQLVLAAAQEKGVVKIVHEKDLAVDPKTGYGAFAWRPDSKALAYVKFATGRLGVIDVETGVDTEIPNAQMNGIQNIAWSADGSMLAFDSGTELKVARVSDGAIIAAADVFRGDPKRNLSKDRYGDFYRFGVLAFSEDGKKIIFQNGWVEKLGADAPPDWVPTILLTLDIATGKVEPLLKSPLGVRRTSVLAGPEGSEFQRSAGRLSYILMLVRSDETIKNENFFYSARPHTCYLYEFDPEGRISSMRLLDFPKPGQEEPNQSRDIYGCRYSAPADMFVVNRREPNQFDDGRPLRDMNTLRRFIETVDLRSGEHAAFIGTDPNLETIWFEGCAPDPTRPWCVTSTSDDSKRRPWQAGDRQYVRLWDLRDGNEVTRSDFFPQGHRSDPQFSPDGMRIAMHERGLNIPIFRVLN